MSPAVAQSITRARVERALQIIAAIVTGPEGDAYLPIFERLERELAALDAKSDALARARSIVAASARFSPSTRHGA